MSSSSTRQKYATCIFKHLMEDGSYGYATTQVDSDPTTWTEDYYRSFIKKNKIRFHGRILDYKNALNHAKRFECAEEVKYHQIVSDRFGDKLVSFWALPLEYNPSTHGIMNIDCFMDIRLKTHVQEVPYEFNPSKYDLMGIDCFMNIKPETLK